jgi:hypothetical protein
MKSDEIFVYREDRTSHVTGHTSGRAALMIGSGVSIVELCVAQRLTTFVT